MVHICLRVKLADGTTVDDRSWVGVGSNVRQLISIGCNVMIDAGSVVAKAILADSHV